MSAELPIGVATRYKPGVNCAASTPVENISGGGWIGSVMGIGMCRYHKVARFSPFKSFALPLLLVAGMLAGCQSGPQAGGGLPGLFGGAPQRVAPGPGTPAPTASPSQANVPPGGMAQPQLPRPAVPSDGIEMQPLPAVPGLVPPGGSEVLRIGFLAPLSGPNAGFGRALFEAAQLALFDLADDRLLLLPRDTEGQPEKAAAAAGQLLAEGAQIIIGPLFSPSTAAVAPLAQARGVKVLSFSTDRAVAGNGTYLLGFTPDQQVERVIAFARTRGMTRFAMLAPDSGYGNAVAQAASLAVTQAGGDLVRVDRYPGDTADLTPIVRRFAAALRSLPPRPANPAATMTPALPAPATAPGTAPGTTTEPALPRPAVDAVLLPEGGARLRALAPLLPFFDIDPRVVKFLGTGLWDEASLGTEPALLGGWFAGPAPDGFADFARRFEQSFGRRPPRLASIAYDATALAGILAKQGGAAAYSDLVLTNPDGFAGYDGIFRFRADGVVERGLAILEVQRRGSRVIDPAPASFRPPVN